MGRPVARRLQAAVATLALAAATGAVLSAPEAAAATGSATGYATQNGGTTGGAGGQTVRATTGTQIHEALCGRADSDTPIVIEVEGTINHGNTTKVSGSSCNTAAGVIELKQISNVTIVGVGSGAVFDQLGIHLREASNIIIQNVTVRNVK
ncbi:pectate lyase, partial [Streptomyces sp. SID7499]|nr:pectate lyase [Streptomyces sp. SID7499]